MTNTLTRQIMDSISRLNGLVGVKASDASFNESDHPRAKNGQFGSGGGGSSKSGEKSENAMQKAERMAKAGASKAEIGKALNESHAQKPDANGKSNLHKLAAVASVAHAKANSKEKPSSNLSDSQKKKIGSLESDLRSKGSGTYKTDKGKTVKVKKVQSGGKTKYLANGVSHGSLESLAKFWDK